jgi:hypothetical protein
MGPRDASDWFGAEAPMGRIVLRRDFSLVEHIGIDARRETVPLPLPLRFLVFRDIAAFSAQNILTIEVAGKIFQTNELSGIPGEQAGAGEAKSAPNAQCTGLSMGRSSYGGR